MNSLSFRRFWLSHPFLRDLIMCAAFVVAIMGCMALLNYLPFFFPPRD